MASAKCRVLYNLMQDPFERADITSNTFWDWQINHVGSVYGSMDLVFQFADTFKEFPPRSFPPSFNPANVMAGMLDDIKTGRKVREAFPQLGVRLDKLKEEAAQKKAAEAPKK